MLNFLALAQSSPGPIAINSQVLISYQLAGMKAVLLAIIATILPPFLFLSLIYYLFSYIADNIYVMWAMTGMRYAISLEICLVLYELVKPCYQNKQYFSLVLAFVIFMLLYFWQLNMILLLGLAAISGILYYYFFPKGQKG